MGLFENNYLINKFATYLLIWRYRPKHIKNSLYPGFEVLREIFVTTSWAVYHFYPQENNTRLIESENMIRT
jgi:hypothetical protein